MPTGAQIAASSRLEAPLSGAQEAASSRLTGLSTAGVPDTLPSSGGGSAPANPQQGTARPGGSSGAVGAAMLPGQGGTPGTGTVGSGGTVRGSSLGSLAPLPEAEARDFLADAQALYPWLPAELLQIFAAAWDETGDANLALAYMRASAAYERYFPANRREDGTFRYTEQEYFATRRGMEMLLADLGQNPAAYAERITQVIGGDVSLQEFGDRLNLLWDDVAQQIPQIRDAYVREFGLSAADPDLTDANLFASFLNPGASLQELRVRVSNSQIVGQAGAQGFNRTFGRADTLRLAGLSGEEARELYGQAAIQVPTLSNLSARYYDTSDPFDLEDFEDALTGIDPAEQEHAKRLVAFERSVFTERGRVAQGEAGALAGLQQR